MPVVHSSKTTCEYCLGVLSYTNKDLLKDRFETIYIICPICDSQVEVPAPEDMDVYRIPLDNKEDTEDYRASKGYLSDDLVDEEDE